MLIHELQFEKIDLPQEDLNNINNFIKKMKWFKFDNGKTYYELSGKKQKRTESEFYSHQYFGKINEFTVYYQLKKYFPDLKKPELILGKIDNGDLFTNDKIIHVKYTNTFGDKESWLFNPHDKIIKTNNENEYFCGTVMKNNLSAIRILVPATKMKALYSDPISLNMWKCGMKAVYLTDLKKMMESEKNLDNH